MSQKSCSTPNTAFAFALIADSIIVHAGFMITTAVFNAAIATGIAAKSTTNAAAIATGFNRKCSEEYADDLGELALRKGNT